jgi:eukaryotic-like serine/threonine-protein kinase
MLSMGSVVAGYRIERVLGAGGMGTVYLAQNPDLARRDALKVLSGELSRSAEFRARFVREAEVASRLAHPNIVSVYSRGETEDGQLWIAMQFVEGTSADDALRSGTMTPARAVHIIAEIGKGLDYAHRHNVVHRDIKPGNFLFSGTVGDDERALLGYFGIARALDDIGLTATGSLIATMAYAAPEVLAGTPIDGRADLYSLGCTLFRLLTGKTPFPNANGPVAVMMAHLHQPPPRVTDRVPGLPPALDAVIATAMAKDPSRRFQTAGDLAAAAVDALRGGAASATAPWTVVPSGEVSSYPRQAEPWWQSPAGPRTMMSPAGQPTQLRPATPPAPQPPVVRAPAGGPGSSGRSPRSCYWSGAPLRR